MKVAEVKWIKIVTDIFDDEKVLLIESLPDAYAIITVWFKLLCLAGKQNNKGGDDLSNQSVDDILERTADYNADCHVDNIAFGSKLFKILEELFHFYPPFLQISGLFEYNTHFSFLQ